MYDMNNIRDNYVNNIPERDLLNDILNPSKRTKNEDCSYSLILHGFINKCVGRAKYTYNILLDIGYSSTILMRRLM